MKLFPKYRYVPSFCIVILLIAASVANAQTITYRLIKLFDKSVFAQNERIMAYQLNSTGDIVAVETNLSVYKVVQN